jgi:hypothetical protein
MLLRSASRRLLPRSILPFIAPKPFTVPPCCAPFIVSITSRSTPRGLRYAAPNARPSLHRTSEGVYSVDEPTMRVAQALRT